MILSYVSTTVSWYFFTKVIMMLWGYIDDKIDDPFDEAIISQQRILSVHSHAWSQMGGRAKGWISNLYLSHKLSLRSNQRLSLRINPSSDLWKVEPEIKSDVELRLNQKLSLRSDQKSSLRTSLRLNQKLSLRSNLRGAIANHLL